MEMCKVKVNIVLGEPDATYSDLKHTGTELFYTVWDEESQEYE